MMHALLAHWVEVLQQPLSDLLTSLGKVLPKVICAAWTSKGREGKEAREERVSLARSSQL